jgi:ribosomal protein L32
MANKVDLIWFDGPCMFLTCLKQEPHYHAVCPNCGAVRYGNLTCPECQDQAKNGIRKHEMEEYLKNLEAKDV